MTTPVLHLMGAAVGFPLAVVMLKQDMVDCEGWDLFTVWKGEHGTFRKDKEVVETPAEKQDRLAVQSDDASQRVAHLLRQQQPALALAQYKKLRATLPSWQIPRELLFTLIRMVLESDLDNAQCVPLMVDYLKQYPEGSERIRLKLAYLLLQHEPRPSQALRVLEKIPQGTLPEKLELSRRQLIDKAQQMRDAGPMELAPEDW
jgi:hypothetical protein